jgi:peptide/nickel transport system permease protein
MLALIARRIGRAALTVLILLTFSFVVMRASGGGATAMLGLDADPAAIAAFNARWGLDRSLPEQYFAYLKTLAQGDFGNSFIGHRPALQVVLERAPATLSLMSIALAITIALGFVTGIAAALRRGLALDRVLTATTTAGYCTPSFVTAIVLILVLSVQLRWLPTTGNATALHYVLPVATIVIAEWAIFARFTRAAMLDALHQAYMRAALAKGLWPREAILLHALPNMAVPLVTIAGLSIGSLFVGATITESVFAWPGVGQLLVSAVSHRDAAIVQTIVILVGVSMVVVNLLVDLSYPWLDPRMRAQS